MNCCVVTKTLGEVSEVWLWRQVVGFRSVSPSVLAWEYVNRDDYPLGHIPLHLLKHDPSPMHRKRSVRWHYRARCLRHLNFYASVGQEHKDIEAYLRRQQIDVVLAQFGPIALRVLPIAQKLGIPLVAHFHGHDISSTLRHRWYRWSLARHANRFAAIVIVGNHQRAWFLDHGVSEDRLHVIPCGVPVDQFKPPMQRPDNPVHFITVSRLSPEKALHHTLSAFSKICRAIPDGRLAIVGDGPERQKLERHALDLKISNRVDFAGYLAPHAVRERLSASHVFLQHSIIREGFGVSLAEAAAMQLPIVSTRCGGIPDQVVHGETGFLVEQHDVDGMAHHMLQLARDPQLRRQMGKAGRGRMQKHFDTTSQIAKLEDVLLKATHPTRNRRTG